ncbi:MAG: dihydrofolate reductase [Alphaproteobacteria bacterium]|nr:dihydrofolate reductase [Alphaproteobacteria bacterium]
MTIVAIWCRHSGDNVIGAGSGLPWKIPSDTRRFRNLTEGQIKVMGRRTYEGMPQKVLMGKRVIVLDIDNTCEVFDKENHFIVDNAEKLKDYPEDLYISGGASVYAVFFTTPKIMPDIVVDCVYGGEICAESKDLININASVSVLEQKYFALPQHFELDGVTTTVWLKKGDFVEQSVVKKILQYLETEGK